MERQTDRIIEKIVGSPPPPEKEQTYLNSELFVTLHPEHDLHHTSLAPPNARLALLRLAQEADRRWSWQRARVVRGLANNTTVRQRVVDPFLRSEHAHLVESGRQRGHWPRRRATGREGAKQLRPGEDPLSGLRNGVNSWYATVVQADEGDVGEDKEGRNGLLRFHAGRQDDDDRRRVIIDDLSLDLLKRKLDKRSERQKALAASGLNRTTFVRDARKTHRAVLKSLRNLPLLYADKAEAQNRRRRTFYINSSMTQRVIEGRCRKPREQAGPLKCKSCPVGEVLRTDCSACKKRARRKVTVCKADGSFSKGVNCAKSEEEQVPEDERRFENDDERKQQPTTEEVIEAENEEAMQIPEKSEQEAVREATLAALEGKMLPVNYSRKIVPEKSASAKLSRPPNKNKPLPPLPQEHECEFQSTPAPAALYTADLKDLVDLLTSRPRPTAITPEPLFSRWQRNEQSGMRQTHLSSLSTSEPMPIGWWQQDGEGQPTHHSKRNGHLRGEGRRTLWEDEYESFGIR